MDVPRIPLCTLTPVRRSGGTASSSRRELMDVHAMNAHKADRLTIGVVVARGLAINCIIELVDIK